MKMREEWLLLKPVENRETTESGIFIPKSADSLTALADVVAVGPGRYDANGNLLPTGLSVGDRIVHVAGAGLPITDNGEKCIILNAHEVFGVV